MNRDNQLDHKEFESLIQSLLPEADQMKVNLLFEEIDTNKDNRITMNEFLAKFD